MWTPIPLPVAGLYDEARIAATSPSDVTLIMRRSGEPMSFTSADAGRTWRSFPIPESSYGVLDWSVRR
jgi:hypothetical protein